jgi:hypothetical protein
MGIAGSSYVRTTKCMLDLTKVMMVECLPAAVVVYLVGADPMTLDDPADIAVVRQVLEVARTTPPAETSWA